MNHTFLQTTTYDDDSSSMWSFASQFSHELSEDNIRRIRYPDDWEIKPISLVMLPLTLAALLRRTSLSEILRTMAESSYRPEGEEEYARSDRDVRFAEHILTAHLIPISGQPHFDYQRHKESSVALLSLADLVSESNSALGWRVGEIREEEAARTPTQIFLASRQDTNFLILNQGRLVVLGGSFEPHQLFSIWRTFIEWLYN